MNEQLCIGFLPLVDACLPILAHEHGFAEEEGLALSFVRDVTWATVLDRLLYGHTDAAHLIAPLAIAASLGRGRPAQPLSAPFVLGLNGNGVTLRCDLAARLVEPGQLGDPVTLGQALKDEVARLAAEGKKLRFGVVHRYSSHNYKLRYWLSASGIVPDRDIDIVTIAPPFVSDALAAGEIDGACVGEPWNSVAVERGAGTIVLATAQIWRRGVEKALAMREPVLEQRRPAVEKLIRAMRKAGAHFVDPANLERNAQILSQDKYVGQDASLIQRAIGDRLVLAPGSAAVHYPDFMFQYAEAANFPWVSQAMWLYGQMIRWEGPAFDQREVDLAARVFRPDVYRSALRDTDDDLPGASSKVEGSVKGQLQLGAQQGAITLSPNVFFDRRTFDPDRLEEYLAQLP